MEKKYTDLLVERFIKYVKIDTKSDPNSDTTPSSAKQFNLATVLEQEMKEMGLHEVSLDENGYIMAKLPATEGVSAPKIGFIAHMDTSPDFSGADVQPKFFENYDGGDLVLSQDGEIVMRTQDFPELLAYKGNTLITTDGSTLLGADNKAGIAEILTAAQYLLDHPEIPHGDIRIGFTPDEEVGRGADHFQVEAFDADFAYTIDGGQIGELEYENFNAAGVKIAINGRNIHPGYAKNKMKNALLIAQELNGMLPASETPATTEGYEGFFHLNDLHGNVDRAEMVYIIRDHNRETFEDRKTLMSSIVNFINDKYGAETVELQMTDQYYNMKEQVEPVIHIVDTAKAAMEAVGVKPLIKAIRGGTDGARLSYMGLPTPNIFTGGHNFHGRFEYIPVESMGKAVETILKIVDLYSK